MPDTIAADTEVPPSLKINKVLHILLLLEYRYMYMYVLPYMYGSSHKQPPWGFKKVAGIRAGCL